MVGSSASISKKKPTFSEASSWMVGMRSKSERAKRSSHHTTIRIELVFNGLP
jgi:hypothetical protein